MLRNKKTGELIEKVLYNNTSGAAGAITLNETSENFTYIEIFYKNADSAYNNVKVYTAHGKLVNLYSSVVTANSLYIKVASVSVWGTAITKAGYATLNATAGTVSYINDTYITRVVGYK